MCLKLLAVGLALFVALSTGAVVPYEEDALFDMVQSFLTQPDEFATALGMTRVKRSSFDRDFNIQPLGARVQIKYLDASNRLKGGKAIITIDDLKKYVPQARSSKVILTINFNSGDSPKDGLFNLSVDYELHHKNVEKGTFKLNRVKEGNLWKSEISVKSANNPGFKIIPVFDIHLKSDRKTMLKGTYTCEHGNNYVIDVSRTPGKKIKAVITGAGKTYTIDGNLDKANKDVAIDVDANGQKYKVNFDFDDSGKQYKLVVNADLGKSGSHKAEMSVEKDKSGAAIKVQYNKRDFLNAKAKGVIKAGLYKYELRYAVVGFGEGKFRFSWQPGHELLVQYLPKAALDLTVKFTRETKADKSMKVHGIATRGSETYLEYSNHVVPKFSAAAYEMTGESKFDMSEKSVLYPIFCKYGCFKTRSMHTKVYVDKAKPYKFSVDVELTKDNVPVLNFDINTRANPYVFKIKAPRILPKILPTGRESIEFEADHNPGHYLKVKSNTNILKSFKVEKLDNEMRRIELNGKELVKAGFKKGDNSISQTTTLPDGRSLTTTISWDSEDMKENKVTIKLDGTERKFDGVIIWNVKNPANIVMKVDAKGQNARWGKYSFMRDIKASSKGGVLTADLKGDSSFDNAPWPSPVKTEMSVKINTNSQDYSIMINKNMAGRNYGATLANGRLSINL